MHRALAMLLAAFALLAPLGIASPAIAAPTLASATRVPDHLGLAQNRTIGNFHSGTAEAEGHLLFLQRDPSGFADSVNLYAAMANDPVNKRDPSGQCVWEGDPEKQKDCWDRAAKHIAAPRRCASVVRSILLNEPVELTEEDARCVFAVYSAKEGVTVTDSQAKQRGADLHNDRLHRRMVRLFALYLLRAHGGAEPARRASGGLREGLRLTESLLGRDLNRYLYGRSQLFWSTTQPIYEDLKRRVPTEHWDQISENTQYPPSAVGGSYFLAKGIDDRVCGDELAVNVFDPMDDPETHTCRERPYRRVNIGAYPIIPAYPVVGTD